MTKVSISLIVAAFLLLAYPLGKKVGYISNSPKLSSVVSNQSVLEPKVEFLSDLLGSTEPVKTTTVKRVLTLEAGNTVILRGPVTSESVGKLIRRLGEVSRIIPKSAKIYLVLDTPGGSIFDGLELIDYIEGLPQEVKTVTLFAASMGFQIVENNPGERLIARNGTLMSHRATGGLQGQFNGEFETRYRMVKRKIDYLDIKSSIRVGQTLEQYEKTIKDEWWVHGFDAVEQKAADHVVLVQCGPSLTGVETLSIMTLFGPIALSFDKCPLVKDPVNLNLNGIQENARPYIQNIVHDLIHNKTKFVQDIILTNKFYNIFL